MTETEYDAEGNLISKYKRETTVGNRDMNTTYTYDALNRIISAHEVADNKPLQEMGEPTRSFIPSLL